MNTSTNTFPLHLTKQDLLDNNVSPYEAQRMFWSILRKCPSTSKTIRKSYIRNNKEMSSLITISLIELEYADKMCDEVLSKKKSLTWKTLKEIIKIKKSLS